MLPEVVILDEKFYPMVYIIDCRKKGNIVRFYLGNDPEYWGDDWDDRSYEHNCGQVYDEYVLGYKDVVFPFDYSVLEPSDGNGYESGYTREDFKKGLVPCIVAIDNSKHADIYWEIEDFSRALGYKDVEKYYFGDVMTPDVWLDKGEK